MRYRRASGGTLELSEGAWATLIQQRQLHLHDPESGGVLLGRLILNSLDVVVDAVTLPGASDHRTRFGFRRSRKRAQERVDNEWMQSDGTTVYLGEWHTHPEDDPSPSDVDCRDRSRILDRAVAEQRFLFFIIVGRRFVRVWEGSQDTGLVDELVPLAS